MELPPAAIEAILAGWPVADLGSIGDAGRPHLVPIVFARRGDAIWSPIDGKPKSGRVLTRLRNVRRDPRVTLLLQHYDVDWTRLWWLRLSGDAEVRTLGPAPHEDERAALDALREKYPQYAQLPLLAPEATLLRVRIAGRRSWCASAEASAGLER